MLHCDPTGDDYASMLVRSLKDAYITSQESKYVPFVADRIAEPPVGAASVNMLDVLPEEVACFYRDITLMFPQPEGRDMELRDLNRRFCKVLGHHHQYIVYLRRREVQDLFSLELPEDVLGAVSLAAVEKSSGDMLRKILMCVPFNTLACTVQELIHKPPPYGLLGCGALSQMRADDDLLAFGSADEGNAFTTVVAPALWRFWQAAPKVRVGDLDPAWVQREEARLQRTLPKGLRVHPCYLRLGMGHTHAAFILLTINYSITQKVLDGFRLPARLCILNMEEHWRQGIILSRQSGAVYIHIDDFGVATGNHDLTNRILLELRAALVAIGFVITIQMSGSVEKYIGLVPCERPAGFEVRPLKMGLLDAVLEDLIAQEYPHLPTLHSVLGIYISYGLLWRPSISAPHALYQFVLSGHSTSKWWPSARQEAELMRGLLPFLSLDKGRNISPLLCAQDASEPSGGRFGDPDSSLNGAFCIAVGQAPIDEVVVVGRRVGASGKAQVDPSALSIHTDMHDTSSIDVLHRTVLPTSWFEPDKWELLLAKQWRWSMHINRGEYRAALVLQDILSRSPLTARLDAVDISDNSVCVNLYSRGRSKFYNCNVDCRTRAALEAASSFRFLSTWVDTTRQPADSGTRPDKHGILRIDRPHFICMNLVLEVFSGCAKLTQACRARDLKVSFPWDIAYGSKFDLLIPSNITRLYNLIRSRHIVLVWLAVPCSTFSTARKWDGGPHPLRVSDSVACAAPWTSDAEKRYVEVGNHLADVTSNCIRFASQVGCLYVVENPARSLIWRLPCLASAIVDTNGKFIDTEFCMWGTPYRKSTKLATSFYAFSVLGLRCKNLNICTRTRRSHIALVGKTLAGTWRTKVAEPYPELF